jgi:HSP20 family protein
VTNPFSLRRSLVVVTVSVGCRTYKVISLRFNVRVADAIAPASMNAPEHHSFSQESFMSLIRWDPFGDVSTFIRLMPNPAAGWPRAADDGNGARKLEWSPFSDISETDKEYVIRIDLPAVKKEDVKVTLDQGVISISGERKQPTEDKDEKFHRVESFYGSFERSFSLPDNVNADAVICDSKDGILTVHIPKIATKKQTPKQITVQ